MTFVGYAQELSRRNKSRKQQRRKLRVISLEEEKKAVAKHSEEGGCRHRLLEVIHSHRFQTFLTILLVVDVLLVVIDLFIEGILLV